MKPPTGCPCGCRSVPGWRDPDCVLASPIPPERASVDPASGWASHPAYLVGWRDGHAAAMRDVYERREQAAA